MQSRTRLRLTTKLRNRTFGKTTWNNKKPASIAIHGIGSNSTRSQHRVNLALYSRINKCNTRLEAAVLPHIISPQPSQEVNIEKWPIPKTIELAGPSFNRPDRIDILLGAEFYHQLLSVGQI